MLVASVEGINGVNRQPSNGLMINLTSAVEKGNFYRQPSKMQINILKTVKKFQWISLSHYLSWSSLTSGSLEISKLEKPVTVFSKTFSPDIYQEIFQNFIGEWPNQPPETQKLISMNLEVNKSYSKSWTPPTVSGGGGGDFRASEVFFVNISLVLIFLGTVALIVFRVTWRTWILFI